MPNRSNCTIDSPWPSCYSVFGAMITVFIVFILILWIILGNLLVIVSVLKDRKLRSQHQNWLILSLATADLLVGLLVMPQTLSYDIVGKWRLGLVLCELWLALDVLFVTSSILNLCVISLDRYWSVTRPLTYPFQRTFKRMVNYIIVAWGLSFVICLPPLVGWRPQREPGECSLSRDLGYVLYSAFGSFYIPVLVLIIVYTKIFSITRKQSQLRLKGTARTAVALQLNTSSCTQPLTKKSSSSFSGQSGQKLPSPLMHAQSSVQLIRKLNRDRLSVSDHVKTTNNGKLSISVEDDEQISLQESLSSRSLSPTAEVQEILRIQGDFTKRFGERVRARGERIALESRQKRLKKRERQATILLGLILAAFILSWLPFFMLYLLGAIGYEARKLLFDICFWMGYCNSGLNPVIYTIFNREFRWAFKRTLRKYFGCFPENKRRFSSEQSTHAL